eukprot:scaffold248394_cov30-Tisochrysis_lutea.AAC.1
MVSCLPLSLSLLSLAGLRCVSILSVMGAGSSSSRKKAAPREAQQPTPQAQPNAEPAAPQARGLTSSVEEPSPPPAAGPAPPTSVPPAEQRSGLHLSDEEVERRAQIPSRQAIATKNTEGRYSIELIEPEGVSANAAAATAAEQDQEFAEAAPPEVKAQVGERWKKYGGHVIEEMMEHTPLITAQYLIALAKNNGLMPRAQEAPESARITKENMWRLQYSGIYRLPVLVLSYPWADPFHPDRAGHLLQQLSPILETMLATAQDERQTGHGTKGCGNKYQTVGVFLDYTALPQEPRAENEAEAFKKSLSELWRWYAHPMTTVMLCTGELCDAPPPTNPKPYDARGWCFCEKKMASLAKGNNILWDIRNYRPGMTYEDMWEDMRKGGVRKPFMSPDRLEKLMQEAVVSGELIFSYNADLSVVVSLYRKAFEQAFGDIKSLVPCCDGLFFKDYGWGDEDLPILLEAFDYMRNNNCCPAVPIRLGGNKFSRDAVTQLKNSPGLIIDI